MFPLLLLVLAFVPMAFETRRSRANDRGLRALGAREPDHDVYRIMRFAYPACFAAMAAEAWLRRRGSGAVFAAGSGLFVAAKCLKYWAIATLGPRWTFRVLVLSGSPLVASGPYRYVRHPNYLGVVGELLGMALMAQAPITGPVAVIGFGSVLLARIRVENSALREIGAGTGDPGLERDLMPLGPQVRNPHEISSLMKR